MSRPATGASVVMRRGRRADHPAVLEMLALAFAMPLPERFAANQLLDPSFRYGDALLALLDGRPVSHLVVHRWRLRVLGGPPGGVPFGGIGEVATDPAARGRGYSSELLRRSIELMAGLRLPLSMLGTPIPEFYARHGWEQIARADYALSFPLGEAPARAALGRADAEGATTATATAAADGRPDAGELEVRPFRPADVDACAALYARFCARRPRALVRPRGYWAGLVDRLGLVASTYRLSPSRALVAVDRASGALRAYLCVRDLRPWGGAGLGVDDAAYADRAAMRALWPGLIGAAVEVAAGGQAAVVGRVPEDHELARLIVAAGGRQSVDHGQMLRLNDLAQLLGHLRQPMERRLRRAAAPPLRVRAAAPYRWLPEDPGGGAALLDWDGRRLTVAPAEGAPGEAAVECPFDSTAWLRLLVGETPLADLVAEYGVPPGVADFLAAALPQDWDAPIYWRSDSF